MKKRTSIQTIGAMLKLARPLAGWMILAVSAGLAGHLCATGITVFAGFALTDLLGQPVLTMGLQGLFWCMAVFALARGLLRYGEQDCNHYVAFRLLARIRDLVFQTLRKLAPAKLEGKDRGSLISLITSDVELLEVFFAHTISPVVIAFLFSLIMVFWIGSFHWILGVIALLSYVTIGILLPLVIARKAGQTGKKAREAAGDYSSYVLETLRGMKEILQFGQQKARLAGMQQKAAVLMEAEKESKAFQGQTSAWSGLLILGADLVMLVGGCLLYANGSIGLAGLILPFLSLSASFGPVSALANLGIGLSQTLASANRVLDLLEETPQIQEVFNQADPEYGDLKAEHVDFIYESEQILDDVSLTAKKGEVLGISGKSGSGKSTLIRLMMRFWDPAKGTMRLDGNSMKEVNTSGLRSLESAMSQTTHLFHDTIRNNIRIANLEVSDQQIEAACKKAAIHDFICSLPQGYDTPVAELGDSLSGGEKQRIGLARAFVHNGPILLLDEPTSNLDSLNEGQILKSLHENAKDKTIILVSHRPSTLRLADRIIQMKKGRLC